NHDGALDLLAENRQGVSVLLGNGNGSFQSPVYSGQGIQATSGALADFNHDGVLDLVTANLHGISVLLGNGDGTFQEPVSYHVGGRSRSVTVGDANGDGVEDLLVTDQKGVSVLLGNGDGTFASPLRSCRGCSGARSSAPQRCREVDPRSRAGAKGGEGQQSTSTASASGGRT